jgi:hypothetical protein
MNIINAGVPSANNMIIRQVMQKKRQSSATIFDKLNKRTAQLTAKNPLNNVLTNDQLFRYYIQEVEPKLSQSNDNFSGIPNMTPPDNSIKDTIEKDFRDEYNAGSGGGDGGFGPLNSNDISEMTPIPPSAPYVEPPRPPQRAPPARPTRSLNEYFSRLPWQEQDALVADWYNNNRPQLLQLIREMLVDGGDEATPENMQLMMSNLERNLIGIVPNVPDNDPERIKIKQEIVPKVISTKQEIVPKVIPRTKQEIVQQQIVQQAQELGFEPEEENEIWRTYGRQESDWPEAGIDEEAAGGMDFPDYNPRYPTIPGVSENFADYFADLPSFDISNPNYDAQANDIERQFQLIGTPRNVGPADNRRENFLMAMANYVPHDSPGWAASRVVPFTSPVSSSIVPRTALLGRAPWGYNTRSTAMRGGRPVPSLGSFGPREEDPEFDSLLAGAPVPKTPSKKKK